VRYASAARATAIMLISIMPFLILDGLFGISCGRCSLPTR
jgi:hypothetical protein